MNEMVNTQTILFLKCIEIGIIMGMIYDVVRIFRKIIPHPNLLVQIEDSLYWIICGLIGFGMLYMHNYGEIRMFVFIGVILGAIFYFATFSIIFMKIANYIIDFVKKAIRFLIHIISIPLKWCLNLIMIPVKHVANKVGIIKQKQKYRTRKLKRKWYHKKADIRTELRIRKKKK